MTEARRPRVLIVTRNLPPLVGGMERLNWHLAHELARNAEVRIVGPSGAASAAPDGILVKEVSLTPLPNFLLRALWHASKIARAWYPDFVLAGSGLTAPLAWLVTLMCGARAAVYVHGLDLAVRHPLYRLLWLPVIRRMHIVIANSQATAALATAVGVDARRIHIVHPGVSLPSETLSGRRAEDVRSELRLSARPILLSVGRLTHRKGLLEFVRDVLPMIVAGRQDATLLVVGDVASDALHRGSQSPRSIQSIADAVGVGGNLRFLGVITDRARLSALYEAADVHVFPVRSISGDPEGFGMVAIESAAHGLQTVAYSTGGVVDAVAVGRSGYLVEPGDASGFAAAVLHAIEHPLDKRVIRDHAAGFAWSIFGEKVFDALSAEVRGAERAHA